MDVTTVHVTKPLTSLIIMDLLEKYSNLTEITCAPSVYKRTSKKYVDALKEIGIEVKEKYNHGAKSQTNGEELEVLELFNQGLKPKEIAEKLGISLNRVYYLLKICDVKPDNRKRKHDHEEVMRLKREGLSAKEIADKLNMSLRTVYYILNKK